MAQLPPGILAAIAAVALVLFVSCGAVLLAALRPRARQRIARWPAVFLLELVALAIVPWLVVIFAPITIRASIHGLWPLIGWIVVALLAFALLVLLPLGALASSLVWWMARRGRRARPAEPASRDSLP